MGKSHLRGFHPSLEHILAGAEREKGRQGKPKRRELFRSLPTTTLPRTQSVIVPPLRFSRYILF